MNPLQTVAWCSEGTGFEGYLADFEFIKAFGCVAADLGGGFATVSTLVMSGIILSIYIRTGSVALPAVLALLTGGAILSTVAAPGLSIITLLILLVPAGVIVFALYRFSQ